MRVPIAEWRRPTDAEYAFRLRAIGEGFAPSAVPCGLSRDIRDVATAVLVAGDAERFERRVDRWTGPEDRDADGDQPYIARQSVFAEHPWRPLNLGDLEEVLRGTVRVLRGADGRTDYVLRDHHMVDVVLYHYATTGTLPSALFHADRHSDWCRDGYLTARRPAQAATWWTLLEGLKRPDGGPVLGERAVHFTTAQPAPEVPTAGRDVGASTRVPWWVDAADLPWQRAVAVPGALQADWVSVDLDYFQPLAQLALTRGLLRDPGFHALAAQAKVRVFVLSPQFTAGGDVLTDWTVRGRHASLRMLNLVRGLRVRTGSGQDTRGRGGSSPKISC